jgi:hypothetical protein
VDALSHAASINIKTHIAFCMHNMLQQITTVLHKPEHMHDVRSKVAVRRLPKSPNGTLSEKSDAFAMPGSPEDSCLYTS